MIHAKPGYLRFQEGQPFLVSVHPSVAVPADKGAVLLGGEFLVESLLVVDKEVMNVQRGAGEHAYLAVIPPAGDKQGAQGGVGQRAFSGSGYTQLPSSMML